VCLLTACFLLRGMLAHISYIGGDSFLGILLQVVLLYSLLCWILVSWWLVTDLPSLAYPEIVLFEYLMCKNMGRAWTVSVGVSRHLFVLNCGPTGSKTLKNLMLARTISYTAVKGCLSSRCCCRWFASCTYPRPVFNLNCRVVEYS